MDRAESAGSRLGDLGQPEAYWVPSGEIGPLLNQADLIPGIREVPMAPRKTPRSIESAGLQATGLQSGNKKCPPFATPPGRFASGGARTEGRGRRVGVGGEKKGSECACVSHSVSVRAWISDSAYAPGRAARSDGRGTTRRPGGVELAAGVLVVRSVRMTASAFSIGWLRRPDTVAAIKVLGTGCAQRYVPKKKPVTD